MQTFRLAGVESQVVLRVMEGFSFKFFDYDTTKAFADKEEAYEMAYLIIVLQTTMHNPNIKQKLRPADFINQAKSCCPKSYDSLPEDYVNRLYDNVAKAELFSPLSRSWYESDFNMADLNICNIKVKSSQEECKKLIDQTEFVNSADLTQKQLYNFNNRINAINEKDEKNLICGALRHIVSMLTNRFLKLMKDQPLENNQVLHRILNINKKIHNYEFTDRILR